MTESKHDAYRHKIEALRNSFVDQLPARLAEARRLARGLGSAAPAEPALLTDLHRFFHTAKGTGNSFGFKDFAQVAGRAESALEPILKNPLAWGAALSCEVGRCLDELELSVAGLRARSPGPDTPSPASEPANNAPPPGTETPSARSAVVYVCDDDPLQVQLMGSQLQYFGYRVSTFSDTGALREAVHLQIPDAVIMDIMFPGGAFEGTDVLSVLQVVEGAFPVIFVSSRSDFEARIRAIRAGGQAYFTKPVEPLDLLGILDRLTNQTVVAPYKILVIDDELAVAQYHALILENAGMVVQIVQQPETILERVSAFKPDLVLMDMYMPYCSGHEAAALIRQIPEFLSLPIIFLSSETDKRKQFSAMSVGVEGFLTKPIQADELVRSVLLSADRMRALQSLMTRDSLTGLFNHTTTSQILENALGTARRGGASLCFAMIDLDRFKAVNDTYGHPMGDQVLLAISRVLRQRLRATDVVGRYGGEEFAVILGDVSRETARDLMDELRLDFSRIVFGGVGQAFSCTFSCGIADSQRHATIESLREAADRALYTAKHGGRNRIVLDGGDTE